MLKMLPYILKRLGLMVPTLIGILALNFLVIQAAPGGPVEIMLAKLQQSSQSATVQFDGSGTEVLSDSRGRSGLDQDLIEKLERQFGFDQPPIDRFTKMVIDFSQFDFGNSFYQDQTVLNLILDKLPVSISLGLWSTLIIYLIAVPLGIKKAIRHGSNFDLWTSGAVIFGYAIPGFLFAMLLIVLFAGGSYWQIFPLRGLTSDNFADMTFWQQILDYIWHLILPVIAIVLGGFASLTLLTKNSFLDELGKPYVLAARAKGASEKTVLYGHVFRNAMLIIIAGFPSAFLAMFFTSALLIEVIFSLDGLGLLGFEAAINRDYPIVFGSLFIFTLLGLILNLISDLMYVLVDPRIDFERRDT